jgi:hypothetical protein
LGIEVDSCVEIGESLIELVDLQMGIASLPVILGNLGLGRDCFCERDDGLIVILVF